MAQDDIFLRGHLIRMILENEELMAKYLALAVSTSEPQRTHYEQAAALLGEVTGKLMTGFRQMYPDQDLDTILRERRREEQS